MPAVCNCAFICIINELRFGARPIKLLRAWAIASVATPEIFTMAKEYNVVLKPIIKGNIAVTSEPKLKIKINYIWME